MGKAVFKKKNRIIGSVLLICFVLFCFSALFFQSQVMSAGIVDKEVTVSAVLGYEGYGKFGRMTPAHIEVSSSVNFEGVVKLVVPTQNGEKNYAYEYPITVEAGKSTTLRADFPLTAKDTLFFIQVIGQDGEEYASCEQRITTPSGQLTELYVGVVSVTKDAYLSFQAQKIGEEVINKFPYVTTRAFGLTTEDITVYPEGMDSLDLIVFDRLSYLKLSGAQKMALENWANEGGILMLEISKNTPWMEVTDYVTEPVETRPIFWTQIKTLEKGRKAYVWVDSDQIDMMEYMAENAGLAPNVLGRLCQAELVTDIVERDHYHEGSEEYEWGSDMLKSSVLKRLPNMAVYVLILIAYLILVGPVLYLYLKKHDKTGLTGRWIFLLAVFFSCLIFLISYPTRFRKPFVQYVTICAIQDGQCKEETHFALRAPFHKAYYMGIDNSYQVRPISDGNYYYYGGVNANTVFTDYQAGIFFHNYYTAVTVEKSAPFSTEYFSIRKYESLKEDGGFVADLTCLTGTVTGTVKNQSGKPLSNVILLTREKAVLLGNMDVEETVRVDGKEVVIYSGDADGKAVYRMLNLSYGTDIMQTASQQTLEQLRALKYYLQNMEVDLDSGILVGFDMVTEPDWQVGTDFEMHGVTLITEKIRFNRTEIWQEKTELLIEDAVWIGTTMEEMVYEYTVDSAKGLKRAVFLQNSTSGYKGEIILFNRMTMKHCAAIVGKEISVEELADCFYERDGRTSIAVLYIPNEKEEEVSYPILRLETEVILEYTFLDEDDISVSNEADYDGLLNTTTSTSIQLCYNLGNTDNLWQVIFADTIVEEESNLYQQFSGNRYFLNTESQIFERAEDEERIFDKESLQSYIDVGMDGNRLTVQYISGTLNYERERKICLPRICVVKKK